MLTGSLAGNVSSMPSSSFSSVVGLGGSLTLSTASVALVVDPPVGWGFRLGRVIVGLLPGTGRKVHAEGLVHLEAHRPDYLAPGLDLARHVALELGGGHGAGLGGAVGEDFLHLGLRRGLAVLGGKLLDHFGRRLRRRE